MPKAMEGLLEAYRILAKPGKPPWRGGSWRLPEDVSRRKIIDPFLGLCGRHGMLPKFCKTNLVETV